MATEKKDPYLESLGGGSGTAYSKSRSAGQKDHPNNNQIIKPSLGSGRLNLFDEVVKNSDWPIPPKDEYQSSDFHVDKLISQFRDLSKPNLFKVSIWSPLGKSEVVNLLAKEATIPNTEVTKITLRRMGTAFQIPGDVNYQDVTLKFHAGQGMEVRRFFNTWQVGYVSNWQDNMATLPKAWQEGKVVIEQLNQRYESVYKVTLVNAWPVNISDIQLSHDMADARSDFSVSFTYHKMLLGEN